MRETNWVKFSRKRNNNHHANGKLAEIAEAFGICVIMGFMTFSMVRIMLRPIPSLPTAFEVIDFIVLLTLFMVLFLNIQKNTVWSFGVKEPEAYGISKLSTFFEITNDPGKR